MQTLRLEAWVQASQVTALHALCLAGWGIRGGLRKRLVAQAAVR